MAALVASQDAILLVDGKVSVSHCSEARTILIISETLDFCNYWSSIGMGNDCNAIYMNQLAWYDQVMQSDEYVLGSTIFSLEIPGWDSFDISPMVPDLIAYLQKGT